MSDFGRFECFVHPRRPDGENVRHYPIQRVSRRFGTDHRRHPHEALSNILNLGIAESRWALFNKADRLLFLRRIEADAGREFPHIRALIEADGPVQQLFHDYSMTRRTDAPSDPAD